MCVSNVTVLAGRYVTLCQYVSLNADATLTLCSDVTVVEYLILTFFCYHCVTKTTNLVLTLCYCVTVGAVAVLTSCCDVTLLVFPGSNNVLPVLVVKRRRGVTYCRRIILFHRAPYARSNIM